MAFKKNNKKEEKKQLKRAKDMDDFELVGAQQQKLNDYYKVNGKLSGIMLVGSVALKSLIIGGALGVLSFFGLFSGNVKNVIDIAAPIMMLGGVLGRGYFYSKEERAMELIEEAETLESEYEEYKDEFNRRMDEYENERVGREIFEELRPTDEKKDEETISLDEFLESFELEDLDWLK